MVAAVRFSMCFAAALMGAGCNNHQARETKDRLSPAAMEQMVKEPMAAVRSDGLAAGRARFGRLLAADEAHYGANSVRAADLVTSFGVALYMDGSAADDRAERVASLDYLRDAISRYRAAFGPKHPEVAVALHSFATADLGLNDGRLTPESERALEEALRIRCDALGPGNKETRATEVALMHARLDSAPPAPNSPGPALPGC